MAESDDGESGDASTQDQILEAVRALIVRHGVRGTSMRSVAEEADVSLGLINYHFDDKASLIAAAFEQVTDEVLAVSLDSIANVEDPIERIRTYISAALSGPFIAPEYLALRISLWAVARTDARLGEIEAKFYTRYRQPLDELVAAAMPGLDRQAVEDRVTDVVMVENGVWLHTARFGDRRALQRAIDRCVAIATEPDSDGG